MSAHASRSLSVGWLRFDIPNHRREGSSSTFTARASGPWLIMSFLPKYCEFNDFQSCCREGVYFIELRRGLGSEG